MTNQLFYNSNCLPAFAQWTELSKATVASDVLTIQSGGYARAVLSGTALSASNVLKLGFTGTCDLQDADNFANYFNIIVEGVTTPDSSGNTKYFRHDAVINKLRSTFDNTTKAFGFAQDIDSLSRDFSILTVTLANNSNRTITFSKAALLRSQDISSAQVGGAIGFGVTLSGFISYIDGFQVIYDGKETPDSAWFMTDNYGKFTGVNWNNERIITYEHKDEALVI